MENEPLVVRVELANISTVPQSVPPLLEQRYGFLTYEISGPKGEAQKYAPLTEIETMFQPQTLAPGDSLADRQLLFYSPNWGVHFKARGTYSVRAVFRLPGRDGDMSLLTSNSEEVTVRAANGANAAALEHFRGNPQALFALGMTTDWVIGREFQTIVEKYPESKYAPWSHYFLGRSWQRRDMPQARAKAERAMLHFRALLKDYPDFPFAVEVRYEIAKELLRLGEKDEAIKRIEELRKSDPSLLLFQRAKEQIDAYTSRGLPVPVDALP
jgi:tetratricopeptide (TPR) repeat protein